MRIDWRARAGWALALAMAFPAIAVAQSSGPVILEFQATGIEDSKVGAVKTALDRLAGTDEVRVARGGRFQISVAAGQTLQWGQLTAAVSGVAADHDAEWTVHPGSIGFVGETEWSFSGVEGKSEILAVKQAIDGVDRVSAVAKGIGSFTLTVTSSRPVRGQDILAAVAAVSPSVTSDDGTESPRWQLANISWTGPAPSSGGGGGG